MIVLQHTVPPLQALIVEQFCDILNPGGVAYVHIPTITPHYGEKGSWMEMKMKPGTDSECDFDAFHSDPKKRSGMQIHALADASVQSHMKRRGCDMAYSEVCSGTGVGEEHCYIFKKQG